MKCRICNQWLEKPFMSLCNSPLSNSFISKDYLYKKEEYYPLDVYICTNCCLMQIDIYKLAEDIFSDVYPYYSSYSSTWLEHSKNYVKMMIERFKYDKKSFVVEIASNDGYLLQYFKLCDIPHLGIEPSSNTAQVAIDKGINTDVSFFNKKYAIENFDSEYKRADLIIGINVFAHNPNLHDFVEGLRLSLKTNGVITLEFPYLLQLIKNIQFDTIYHEHFSYFSLKSIIELFNQHQLSVFDIDELPTHGGSLRVYIKHVDDCKLNNNNDNDKYLTKIRNVLHKEENFGLYKLKTYDIFKDNVYKIKRDFIGLLCAIKSDENNNKIACYGAAAKGNTLLNFCNIGTDFIDYVVDISPHKQGLYLPGTHIPIYSPDEIIKTKPDYIIILPWNIKDEIMKQLEYTKKWGCKFIIPIPKVDVIC